MPNIASNEEIYNMVAQAVSRAMEPFTTKIEAKIDRLQSDHRMDYEQLRRDVAAGFVSRDVLEPQLVSLRAELARVERDKDKEIEALQKALKENQLNAISTSERMWMRVFGFGGLASVGLSLLSFYLQHPLK